MTKREIIGSSIFAVIFLLFLFFLHSLGKITVNTIMFLILIGVIFVWLTQKYYRNFWGNDE